MKQKRKENSPNMSDPPDWCRISMASGGIGRCPGVAGQHPNIYTAPDCNGEPGQYLDIYPAEPGQLLGGYMAPVLHCWICQNTPCPDRPGRGSLVPNGSLLGFTASICPDLDLFVPGILVDVVCGVGH